MRKKIGEKWNFFEKKWGENGEQIGGEKWGKNSSCGPYGLEVCRLSRFQPFLE